MPIAKLQGLRRHRKIREDKDRALVCFLRLVCICLAQLSCPRVPFTAF